MWEEVSDAVSLPNWQSQVFIKTKQKIYINGIKSA